MMRNESVSCFSLTDCSASLCGEAWIGTVGSNVHKSMSEPSFCMILHTLHSLLATVSLSLKGGVIVAIKSCGGWI